MESYFLINSIEVTAPAPSGLLTKADGHWASLPECVDIVKVVLKLSCSVANINVCFMEKKIRPRVLCIRVKNNNINNLIITSPKILLRIYYYVQIQLLTHND